MTGWSQHVFCCHIKIWFIHFGTDVFCYKILYRQILPTYNCRSGISMQTPATQPQDRPRVFWISFSRRKYQEKQHVPHQQPQKSPLWITYRSSQNFTLSNKCTKNSESVFKFYYSKGYPLFLSIFPFSYKVFSAIISAAGTALSCCHFSVTASNFSQARAVRYFSHPPSFVPPVLPVFCQDNVK